MVSLVLLMITNGSLVVYKNRPALVKQTGPKLEIELEEGKTIKVRPKDVALLHPGPLLTLSELQPQIGDEESAWEILADDTITIGELAELMFETNTPVTAWSAWQLVSEGIYFQGSPEAIRACSPEEVSQRKEARQLRVAEREAWSAFLNRAMNREIVPEDSRFISGVEDLALGRTTESRVLRALGRKQSQQSAHSLLLELGYWSNGVNPYPKRLGLILSAPSADLPELQDEDRLDLTHLTSFAIDNEWTSDPDDAISLEGNHRLWVHIADVAALVSPNSPADIEACIRAANLYLPEMTVTMLPPAATERLALGLHDISPALSFGLQLDSGGGIAGVEIVPSWVRVTRLSYEQAETMLDESPLEAIYNLTRDYESCRRNNGAISIELPEVSVRVVDGYIVIRPLRSLRSQTIVREAMLMVGDAVAQYAFREGIPLPFTTQERIEVTELPHGLAGNYALRRFMKPSQLKSVPSSHAGLGLDLYIQSTSPLRRYQDLVIHQQLRAYLRGDDLLGAQEILDKLGAAEAITSSLRKAERLSCHHWTLVYLSEHPEWRGEGILVEKYGSQGTVLIPDLGLETRLYVNQNLPLNSRLPLQFGDLNIPELQTFFRIDS